MERSDMPVGFAMALAMNPDAMRQFSTRGEDEKRAIIEGTHAIRSKDEMRRYVDNLGSNNKTDTIG